MLGQRGKPGHDTRRFCKPSAVSANRENAVSRHLPAQPYNHMPQLYKQNETQSVRAQLTQAHVRQCQCCVQVAVSNDGDVFVADGQCNSRVMHFSPTGRFVQQMALPKVHIHG